VVKGPDPEKDKVIRWRCLDLQAEIARLFSVRVHESTVGKWLRLGARISRCRCVWCHVTDYTVRTVTGMPSQVIRLRTLHAIFASVR
jgi:hypothetical protein